MSFQEEGSMTFWCRHKHRDWPTNSNSYNFSEFTAQSIKVKASKHSDRTVELNIDGPLGQQFNIRKPIPECDEGGLFVAITWGRPEVKVYLNGKLVETNTV